MELGKEKFREVFRDKSDIPKDKVNYYKGLE